jgi:hypothetical protein
MFVEPFSRIQELVASSINESRLHMEFIKLHSCDKRLLTFKEKVLWPKSFSSSPSSSRKISIHRALMQASCHHIRTRCWTSTLVASMHSRCKLQQVTTVAKLVDHRSDPQQKKDKDNNNNNNNNPANCRRLWRKASGWQRAVEKELQKHADRNTHCNEDNQRPNKRRTSGLRSRNASKTKNKKTAVTLLLPFLACVVAAAAGAASRIRFSAALLVLACVFRGSAGSSLFSRHHRLSILS